ncbi:hypothetical protein PCL_06265 [Purpureocillium lilacinum]|uniref:Uncharacterized protein n=1 Tax=Purpureocillium lilacinum TaxID=33203 RepID=A0A2U3EM62_PURLI|nr:hypothetical protein Purlil1_4090 [Purpureocillium lilacinum]PWI75607.1 hypothetical protein PCL_06265 [Purpureocillium lilacinum]
MEHFSKLAFRATFLGLVPPEPCTGQRQSSTKSFGAGATAGPNRPAPPDLSPKLRHDRSTSLPDPSRSPNANANAAPKLADGQQRGQPPHPLLGFYAFPEPD